ncbi:MAG: aminotransferase class V-fold PLP-dependent enzyme [Marmoricola sp.]
MSFSSSSTYPASSTQVGALLELVGGDLEVPLVTGGTVRYANLDVAASAPALTAVRERVDALLPLYSSVHRGAGYASQVCTAAYEAARVSVGAFVGARDGDVVQFVRNTTDALNLLASAVPGPVVHLDIEHHANLLPWRGLETRTVLAGSSIEETLRAVEDSLAAAPAALLAVTGASNVTGETLPIARLAAIAHRHGARIVVDGAQLVPHRRVDLSRSGVDYLAFSGHKLYAPFGAGVLIGRPDWLAAAPPYVAGGGAVRQVTLAGTTWADVPARHEGGTPNVIGAVAIAAACDALSAVGETALIKHEKELAGRLHQGLRVLPGVRILSLWGPEADRVGVVTFTVDGFRADHVAQYLSAEHGIGVRDGRFCAHPLLDRLLDSSVDQEAVRASIGVGTTGAHVDRLLSALRQLVEDGPRWTYARTAEGLVPKPDPRPLPTWQSADLVVRTGGSACRADQLASA